MRRFWLALAALLLLGAGRAEAKWQSVLQTVIASGGGGGAVSYKWSNGATANFTGITSVAIGKDFPAGSCGTFSAGDFLVSAVSVWTNGGSAPGTISTPTGWTLGGNGTPTSDTQVAWFYKFATGSESCSTGFSASWTTSTVFVSWGIADFNSSGSGPTLDVAGTITAGSTGAGTALTASSISPTGSTDMLIYVAGSSGQKGPYTGPSGFTTPINTSAADTIVLISYNTLSASGATGSVSAASTSTFDAYAAALVAIKP